MEFSPSGSRVMPERLPRAEIAIAAMLAAVLLLPAGTYYVAETSSMSAGVLVASFLVLAMRLIGILDVRNGRSLGTDLAVAAAVTVLLAIHLVARALIDQIDGLKAVGSLGMAVVAIGACGTVGSVLGGADDGSMRRCVAFLMGLFLLVAVLSLLGWQPLSATATSKPIFPFTEPSLYAGPLLPIIAFLSVTSHRWQRWAWVLTGFLLAFSLENLSLAVGSLVVMVACLTTSRLVVAFAAAAFVLPFLDLTYFTDRIQFDTRATTNLSALVYIQGWEFIDSATHKTFGWGLGFQQLGFIPLNAPTSDLIYRITNGTDLNLKEGSFAAAKFISELGFLGLAFVVLHLYLALRSFLLLRQIAMRKVRLPLGQLFALCSVYTFMVDMYVRGAGYFSSPTLLMVSSLFVLWDYGFRKVPSGNAAQ